MPRSATTTTADAWVQVRVPGRNASSTQVEFRFSSEYVRSIWQANPMPVTRTGHISPETETLLLDDVIELPDVMIHVAAWLIPSRSDPKVYHLRVDMDAPKRVKREMFVTLHWGHAQYDAYLHSGAMRFQDITLPDFSRKFNNFPSRDFCLTFEYKYGGKN